MLLIIYSTMATGSISDRTRTMEHNGELGTVYSQGAEETINLFRLNSAAQRRPRKDSLVSSRGKSYANAEEYDNGNSNEDESENHDSFDDGLPEFMAYKMSTKELVKLARDMLFKELSPLQVGTFLNSNRRTEFLNFVMILNGLQHYEKSNIFQELLGLWGFYLTLQDDPSAVALREMQEVLTLPCFTSESEPFMRYHDILVHLIEVCKRYSILKTADKRALSVALEQQVSIFNLNMSLLRYLHDVDYVTLRQIMTGHEYVIDEIGSCSVQAFRLRHEKHREKIASGV